MFNFNPFGYFANLKFYNFVLKDVEDIWYALCEYEGNMFEYPIMVEKVKVKNRKEYAAKLYFQGTPYGDLDYYSLNRLIDMSHQQYLPPDLLDDIRLVFEQTPDNEAREMDI